MQIKYTITKFYIQYCSKVSTTRKQINTSNPKKKKKKFLYVTTHLKFSSCSNLFLYYSSSLLHESSFHHFLWNKAHCNGYCNSLFINIYFLLMMPISFQYKWGCKVIKNYPMTNVRVEIYIILHYLYMRPFALFRLKWPAQNFVLVVPLLPLSKLRAIHGHTQNLEEQIWMEGTEGVSVISHRYVNSSSLIKYKLDQAEYLSTCFS